MFPTSVIASGEFLFIGDLMADKSIDKIIEECVRTMYKRVNDGKKPRLKIPKRTLSNVIYDTKEQYLKLGGKKTTRTLNYNIIKSFVQTIFMLRLCKELSESNEKASKRELYYIFYGYGDAAFQDQPSSDKILDDVEAMFSVTREMLGVYPEERGGAVAGNLTVIDKDKKGKDIEIDCGNFGSGAYSVPVYVEDLSFKTKAEFILVVETAGLFQRLNNNEFAQDNNCIMITTGGMPTRASRRFIRRLSDDKDMDVYVLNDSDPWGFTIYRVLKVGSASSAHVNDHMSVPRAVFMGVTPADIKKYDLPTHPLGEKGEKKIDNMLKDDPYIKKHKDWQKALKKMKKMGVRCEQQSFAKYGLNHVIDTYLPEKLADKSSFLV